MMEFKKFKTAAAAVSMEAVMRMGTVVSAAEDNQKKSCTVSVYYRG